MHENRNLFFFLIEINNMHHTRHIYQYPGLVFGASVDGAVFHDIVRFDHSRAGFLQSYRTFCSGSRCWLFSAAREYVAGTSLLCIWCIKKCWCNVSLRNLKYLAEVTDVRVRSSAV